MTSSTISFRVSDEIVGFLDARATEEGRGRSAVIKAALAAYLDAPCLTVELRLKAVERAVASLHRHLDRAPSFEEEISQ